MSDVQPPRIGRIVYFVCPTTGKHRAAIVNEVGEGNRVGLKCFRGSSEVTPEVHSSYVVADIPYCPDFSPMTWHYPE
jgi:hypothetical protein